MMGNDMHHMDKLSPNQGSVHKILLEGMCMEIIQRFIPESNKETRPGIPMNPTYITIHETDNTSPGADAEAHANLQYRGNTRQASWHVQVDDHEAIQSIPFDEVAWAAGDGANGPGNLSSIHIEICVNSDGNYKKAVENAVEVTWQLMVQFKILPDHVVQHNHWSGKNCPRMLRSGEKGITWDEFIQMLKEHNQPVLWEGKELRSGQIGRITILKPINLWKRNGNQLEMVRILQPGEVYRVYSYDEHHGGQYGVGGGLYVTNMPGYIKYETPSKAKLDLARWLATW
jgi:N-acetylmuramoyl-L-alanine amidase